MTMRIAISGAHGAGKTTLLNHVIGARPGWSRMAEATRTLVPALGYSSPYDIVGANGIAMYEAMIISSWNILRAPSCDGSNQEADDVLLLDRSPVDNLAYYYVLRSSEEAKHEDLLVRLTKFFLQEIDLHVFVPLLPFPVALDGIQPRETQQRLQEELMRLYDKLSIRHLTLSATDIDARTNELIGAIEQARAVDL